MSCADKYRNHIYENASRNILIPNITSEECRCGLHRQLKGLFFLWFPFCMGEGGLVITPLYSYFFSIGPCCWPFLSTYLPPLAFLDISSHNPPISHYSSGV